MALNSLTTEPDRQLVADFQASFPEVFYEQFSSTLKQALFLSNSEVLHDFVKNSATAKRLAKIDSNSRLVVTAFEILFGRQPSEVELSRCVEYFQQRENEAEQATSQFLWALVTSSEFRLNH